MPDWSAVTRLLTGEAVAHIATVRDDGGPHSTPVWMDVDGPRLAFFTQEGSAKDRHLRSDPRVAVSITAPSNPLDMASIRGEVVERLEGERAMAVVDRIARAYTGEPYDVRSGFVAFAIQPSWWTAHDYSAGS